MMTGLRVLADIALAQTFDPCEGGHFLLFVGEIESGWRAGETQRHAHCGAQPCRFAFLVYAPDGQVFPSRLVAGPSMKWSISGMKMPRDEVDLAERQRHVYSARP